MRGRRPLVVRSNNMVTVKEIIELMQVMTLEELAEVQYEVKEEVKRRVSTRSKGD